MVLSHCLFEEIRNLMFDALTALLLGAFVGLLVVRHFRSLPR